MQTFHHFQDRVEESASTRQNYVYQLLRKEQQYALCLQFGISRFLLPLAERRDVMRPNEHQILFQNVQEVNIQILTRTCGRNCQVDTFVLLHCGIFLC